MAGAQHGETAVMKGHSQLKAIFIVALTVGLATG